jgi:DNA polymerase-3 subunit epsilon
MTMHRLFKSTGTLLCGLFAALAAVAVLAFVLAALPAPQAIQFLAVVASLVLAALGWFLARRHVAEIERMRGAVAVMLGDLSRSVPPVETDRAGSELSALHRSLGDLVGRLAAERNAPDERLTDVVAAVGGGLLVITENGLVSLINAAARDILGERGTACGTSVYDVFSRHSLAEARGKAAGGPAEVWLETVDGRSLPARLAPLARHGGAVIWLADALAPAGNHVDLALDLHDQPPAVSFTGGAMRLDALPAIVIDTETTGLDVRRDRIVSFGSVSVFGTRLYRAATQDLLINPAMAIPKRSIAVHGITDAMAAEAPALAARWPTIEAALKDKVVIGHNIGFDAAILAGEAERLGLVWKPAALIDTLLLAAALDPARKDLTLDGLAAVYGITIEGRHTALGDALVTAELYVRLVDNLKARGVTTLGQAIDLVSGRSDLIRAQRERGWMTAV